MWHARLSSTKSPLLLGLRYRACVVMWVIQVGECPNPPPQAVFSQTYAYLLTADQEAGRVGVNRIVGLSVKSSDYHSVPARLYGYLCARIGNEEKTCCWSYWNFFPLIYLPVSIIMEISSNWRVHCELVHERGIGNLCWDKSVWPSREPSLSIGCPFSSLSHRLICEWQLAHAILFMSINGPVSCRFTKA